MLKTILLGVCSFLQLTAITQVSTGNITGKTTFNNEQFVNVLIELSNELIGLKQKTTSNILGHFQFNNLVPGLSYQLKFSSPFTDTLLIQNIQVMLGKSLTIDVSLQSSINHLQPILIKSNSLSNNNNINQHLYLSSNTIDLIPKTARDFGQLFRLFPQAFIKESATGAVSFSGQNNRYNSLYVDGALQNDAFGLSTTGFYGGQTGNIPIAFETIDQVQLLLSPYDASLGGYTGAAINMITKSGKNRPTASFYRYMRGNQELYNNTGIVLSGPLKINRLFYFFNIDFLREAFEAKYDFNNYNGDTKNITQFNNFINSINTNYNYDPGSLNKIDNINAVKLSLRMDYQISATHSLTVNLKKNSSDRSSSTMSNNNILQFNNSGKFYQNEHFSGSIELKSSWKKNKSNKLLFSYNNAYDETIPLGKAFPSINILDGNGYIILGSNEDATLSKVLQKNYTITNQFNFVKRKHFANAGFEIELNSINNHFLHNSFGNYFYYSIKDFLRNSQPGSYEINFNKNKSSNGIQFSVLKTAFFVNDKIVINKKVSFLIGARITAQQFLTAPISDSFTKELLIPTIKNYYDLNGADVAQKPIIPLTISPRLNLIIHLKKQGLEINAGTGVFSGRMPLAWLGGIYSNNGLQYESYEATKLQLRRIRLKTDVYNQWLPSVLGDTGNRGVLNIIPKKLRMPSVWRSTLQINKSLKSNWTIQAEAMYYINTNEINFLNMNMLPPIDQLIGSDNRLVYRTVNAGKIPILPDSSNPYDQIILLKNNEQEHGFGYRYGIQIKKETKFEIFTIGYAFGESYSVFDGNYSVLLNQWRLNENVNGRNNIKLARSDFSPGHRINASFMKEWFYNKKKQKLSLSLIYNGYSGTAFSYVYGKKSIVRDDMNSTGYELIYIPTSDELSTQIFEPIIAANYYYAGDQQKEALEWYIQNNTYLNLRRGMYAERNGSRTPFTNRIDLKISSYAGFELNKRKYGITFSLELFNLGNLISSEWGKNYAVPGNRFRLIDFMGFINETQLIPTFNFNPLLLQQKPWQEQVSRLPTFSREWLIQAGFRINFY